MSKSTAPTIAVRSHGEPGWDEARRAFNLSVQQEPAAIARPRSAAEVQDAVRYARRRRLRVAAQSTGHGAAPLGALRDTVLVRTGAMSSVAVDPSAGTVTAGAGATWQQVTQAAARHGLAVLAGSSPSIGVAGYTLGGGISWLARLHGLACNHVLGLDVVTADGELVRVDAIRHPDLFWALRGGGGSFALVAAITFRALPITSVVAGLLWWPVDAAPEVLQTWRELTRSALPDALMTSARLLRMPDVVDLPARLRGGSFVVVDAVLQNPAPDAEREARDLLAPLLRLQPQIDTLARIPARCLGRLHSDLERPTAFIGDAMTLDRLTAPGVDTVLRLAGPTASAPLPVVELRHLGGEVRRVSPDGGALAAVDADYLLCARSPLPGPTSRAPDRGRSRHRVVGQIERLQRAMSPWAARQAPLNFAERPVDPSGFWPPDAYARLRRIKTDVDPDDRIRSNHPVLPIAAS